MRIGEVAKISRCPAVTIRYYEKEGLLKRPERTERNYRLYGEEDMARLRFIRHCRQHGMSLDEIRTLPAAKKYGDDVKVSMYMYDRPSWTGEVYETEAYFPTWINKETAPHVKALVDAHKAMFGDERIGCEPSMDKRTGRPLCDKWTFSTNCVSIQGRYGIPCVGFGPGAESQAHAPNEVTYKDDLVTAAAMYVAALNLYDPSQADGDATVFRAGLTNNKID